MYIIKMWKNLPFIPSILKISNENGTYLIDFCKLTGMRIMNGRVGEDAVVGKYTCVKENGCSVVDYVLCRPDMIPYFNTFLVGDPNICTDHCAISFSLGNLNVKVDELANDSCEFVEYTYKWDNDKKDMYINTLSSDIVKDKLTSVTVDLQFVQCPDDIDTNLDSFYSIIDGVCGPIFRKTVRNGDRSDKNLNMHSKQDTWYDCKCKEKQKEFYKSLNSYRREKSNLNRQNMVRKRSEYKTLIRNQKYAYDKLQTRKLESMRFKNAKEYWKMLKGVSCPKKSNNLNASNFTEYFKAINDPESNFYQPDDDIIYFNERYLNGELQVMFDELNCDVTNSEILKACKELSLGRSGGPDCVLNEFFKYGIDHLICYLSGLFNTILNTGYFPKKWTEGFIVPLHKKGDLNQVDNYRGITLLSTLSKLFTRILNNRLVGWAERYHIYVEAQSGFRKSMGTIDNIFILHGIINHLLNENKKLYVAFIDFTKAFDYVVRDILWYKLLKYGVRGKIINVLRSMYKNVQSRIKYENQLSVGFQCVLGVRQGECLSPFLFAMYLNDLEETFELKGYKGIEIGMLKLMLLLYADDIVILSESEAGLQMGLDILKDYCDRWKLTVNVNKTKVMIFRKGGTNRRNVKFDYNGVNIDIVNKFTYLGVVFTTGGSFSETHDALAGQALKAIFKLKSLVNKFTDFAVSHMLGLFDKLILPILNYSGEVWGFSKADVIERIHLRFCKQLLGVRVQTQNNFIYGELGRMSLRNYRFLSIMRYWFKILNCDNTKIIKQIYNTMLEDMQLHPEISSWAKSVKQLLESLGFNHVWLSQGVGDVTRFMSIFKVRISDHFIQNWSEQIENSTRANTYKLISVFQFQCYLDIIKVKKIRYAFTRLRVSSHRLAIETGRWHKPDKIPLENRKCQNCNTLEDEFHFILECSLYQDLRAEYIKRYYWVRPNMPKFIELLKSENKTTINKLSVYIFKSFQKRNEIFYPA